MRPESNVNKEEQVNHQYSSFQKALLEISSLTETEISLNVLYRKIHHIVSELIYAENFYILIASKDRSRCKFDYYADIQDPTPEWAQPNYIIDLNKTRFLSTHVLETGKPLFLKSDELQPFTKQNNIPYHNHYVSEWLGVPLIVGELIYGAIIVQSYDPDIVYSLEEKDLLLYIARHIAMAYKRKVDHDELIASKKIAESQTEKLIQANQELKENLRTIEENERLQSVLYQITKITLADIDTNITEQIKQMHRLVSELLYARNLIILWLKDKPSRFEFLYYEDQYETMIPSTVVDIKVDDPSRPSSFSEYVIRTRKTQYIIKGQEPEGVRCIGPESKYWLGVPLFRERDVRGVLIVQSYDKDIPYSDKDCQIIEYLSDHISAAIGKKLNSEALVKTKQELEHANADLEQRVEKRTRELSITNAALEKSLREQEEANKLQSIMYEISEYTSSAENLNDLIKNIQHSLSKMIYAENLYVALVNDDRNYIRFVYYSDTLLVDPSWLVNDVYIGEGHKCLTGHAISLGKPTMLNKDEITRLENEDVFRIVGPSMNQWIGIPLKSDSEIIGILVVQSYSDKLVYNNRDKELLIYVSHQIELSISKKQKEIEAQSATKAKTEFLANISHELRTPLNAIIGYSALTRESGLDAPVSDYVKNISTSSKFLLTLINDILDFSKIDTGNLRLEQTDFNLISVIKDTISMFDGLILSKGIKLKLSYEKDSNYAIQGDSLRIKQILVNLLSNATKFTDKGYVEIFVDSKPSQEHKDKRIIHFSIKDTGIGIPPEKTRELFRPFTQVDASTTREYGGTGLGLSICYHLIELMGGKLKVKSQAGVGSEFYFDLQFKVGKDTNERATLTKTSYAPLKGKVLIVDDNIVNRMLVDSILTTFGLEPIQAEDGEQAIKAVNAQPFDLVLMDIQMPTMDGLQATKKIRSNPKHQHLPIIACTAHTNHDEKRQCIDAGMNEHLPKPITPQIVYTMLQKYLS